jgi:hypothetical protein
LAARQELHVSVATSCFAALAEVLMNGSDADARVLVLQEPRILQGVVEVLTRLERYLGGVKVWTFVSEPRPTLRGLQAGDLKSELPAASCTQVQPRISTQVPKVPQVVVVPGIGAKIARPGVKPESSGGSAWTPRVVGQEVVSGVAGPETQPAKSDVPDNPKPPVQPSAGGNPSGSFVGGVRSTSLLSDEELSMLLANDQDREHT